MDRKQTIVAVVTGQKNSLPRPACALTVKAAKLTWSDISFHLLTDTICLQFPAWSSIAMMSPESVVNRSFEIPGLVLQIPFPTANCQTWNRNSRWMSWLIDSKTLPKCKMVYFYQWYKSHITKQTISGYLRFCLNYYAILADAA